ncbi:MAG: zinc ribbon domain-containing protein [Promethearchaeota archaeon]
MKYEKNQYTEGFSICGLIIAGAFFFWGITSIIAGGWWGIILIGIGIAISLGLIRAIVNKKKLRNAVKYEFESNPNATVEDISKSTGISKKDVQAIILDLKMSGELRGKFSSKTGQLKTVPAATTGKTEFCPSCGAHIEKEGAQFCNYCGAEIK